MNKWILIFALAISLVSCEKDINFKLDNPTPKLVVDAQIETGQPPVVVLSNSLSYFSSINSSILANSFVRGAKVVITDGVKTHQLREYSYTLNGNTFYYYTNDIAIPATAITGQNGKQYSMTIEVSGTTYTATTNIPPLTKKIDSLWWKKAPNNPDTTTSIVMARVTDPPGFGNYIRYFTRNRNNNPFLPGENSTFDDQVIDGKTYDVQVSQGIDRNKPSISRDSAGYFYRGDTVTVKFCNIDKASYDFWNTWEFAYQAIGNPFSAPNKVIGNISNGALGAFCGYAVQLKTVVIPK
jgi:hypothetical protein